MPSFIPTDEHDRGLYIKEAGQYELRVTSCEEKLSNAGNDMLVVSMEDVKTGASIRDQIVFTEKAFWKAALFAKSCGIQICRGEALVLDQGRLKGRTCIADVIMVPGDKPGVEFAEVDRYVNPAGTSLFKEGEAATAPTPTQTENALEDEGNDGW